jgi:hypothetical protein
MLSCPNRWSVRLFATVCLALLCASPVVIAREAARVDKLPDKVLQALHARFPKAEIHKWTREKEDGRILFDIEFTQEGRKLEADIAVEGTIVNWEQEIPSAELPAAVRTAVEKRYPGADLRQAMAMTAVKDGGEKLEGYEILLQADGKREVEITVAPDGTVLEDSGRDE